MTAFGFVPDPGTDWSHGQTPVIARRLDELAKKKHITIYGISGYRTPGHSVEVGGSANDPHTKGQAADIGVNGSTRASAGTLSDADLASVGLVRPFSGAQEINHVQLANTPHPGKSNIGSDILHVLDPGNPFDTNSKFWKGDQGAAGAQLATDVAKGPVTDAFTAGFNALWDAIKSRAEYAGVFVLLLAAGAYMAVRGLTRTAGRPQGAPA